VRGYLRRRLERRLDAHLIGEAERLVELALWDAYDLDAERHPDDAGDDGEQQAGIEYVTPTQAVISSVYEETLRSVGKLLGLTDEAITAPGGSDALLAAARSAALAGPLGDAITRANADPGLTRKVVDVASIDVGVDAGTLEAALDEAVADAVKAYPAIKRPTYPDRSGASFPAGSSQSEILTRDVIAQMTPEAVNQARKAGMIPGFAADAS